MSASAPPRRTRRPSDGLAWLGGADREILLKAQSGRAQFIQLGLVVIATASIAMLSMGFALRTGLHLSPALAVLGGLVWGCVFAVIDRFLITTLNLRGPAGRVLTIIGIRLFIAALLGVIISTPLVLQIFRPEIQAQIVTTNVTADQTFGDALNATPIADELARVRTQIATNEAALAGQIPPVSTPEVQTREQYLEQAQDRLTALQTISDEKYRAWQCELYGASCEGSTSDPGNGNLAQAREREYRDALAQTTAAQQAVTEAEQSLTDARQAASAQTGAAVQQAQDAARAELPGLRERERALEQQYNDTLDTGSTVNRNNDGILAQLTALHALGQANGQARLAHWAVGLLFFMIELLPVLVKILSGFGPPSAYERVRDLIEEAKVDDAKVRARRATRQRDEDERRFTAEAKKRYDIEEDMRTRERDLGVKPNKRVAQEMERVLDAALADWASQVRAALGAGSTTGTTAPPSAPPVAPVVMTDNFTAPMPRPVAPQSSPPASSSSQLHTSIRSNFNMPNGHKLDATKGGQP